MSEELIATLSGRNGEHDAFAVSYRWAERDYEDVQRFMAESYEPADMLRQLKRERRRLQRLGKARSFLSFVDRTFHTRTEERSSFREFHRAEWKCYRFAMMRDQGIDADLMSNGYVRGKWAEWRRKRGTGERLEFFEPPEEFVRFTIEAEKLILEDRQERAAYFESPGEFVRLAKYFNRTEDEEPFLWLYAYTCEFLEICPKPYLENGVFGKFMRSVFGVFLFSRTCGNQDFTELAKLAGYFATSYLFDDILDDPEYSDREKKEFSQNVIRVLRSGRNEKREFSEDVLMSFTESALGEIRDILDEDRGKMVAQSYLAIAEASAVGARWNYETPLTGKEMYAIAAVKAAYTRVIPAILGGHEINAKFLSHCMRAGLIYQLTDDLRDIPEDLAEQNVTPFNYFRHGASKLEVHPVEVFLAAASRISSEYLPNIAGAEALWIMRLSHSLRVLRLKYGEAGLEELFTEMDFPAGRITDELARVGECAGEIIDIEAEAAKVFSDIAVRMRGGWTKEPVHGH